MCGNYEDLTENHVPPESVGNATRLIARSYMTSVTANRDLFAGRQFHNGLKFRTLCAGCNNGLGGKEDKAIGSFFQTVRKVVESPLILPRKITVSAKPNLIYRGLLAHLASANDTGVPTSFDEDVRSVFRGKAQLRNVPWNLYYWTYLGPTIYIQRRAFVGLWSPFKIIPMFVLKAYPLGFLFTTENWFGGLPNLKKFIQPRDDQEFDVPLRLLPDVSPIWPAETSDQNVVFMGGDSYGILGFKN